MSKPLVTIYTDGGSKPNPGPGGWAALLIAESGHEKELSGSDPDTTNNRMELTAAVEALRALKKPCRVTLYTDSQYLKQGITKWLPGWIARNWQRKKDDQPVLNEDLWRALHAESQKHHITWQWVKGHAGNLYNERVDQLATAARRALTGADEPPQSDESPFTPDFEIALRVSVPQASTTGGWAVRIACLKPDTPAVVHTGRETATSSNRLELVAALNALRHTPAGAAVRVYCPSDYLYSGMTAWVDGWQQRNWITASKTPVQHRDIWQALVDETHQRDIAWVPERHTTTDLAHGLDKLAYQEAQE